MAVVMTDNSSGSMPLFSSPVGDTYRGIGSSWFNAENIAKEDWMRAEQSAHNAFARDLAMMREGNKFNAGEAQKNRDFQERMSNTAYQRAIQDMKLAGINPLLAVNQGGASTPSGSSASSSSGHRSSGFYPSGSRSDPLNSVLGAVLKVVAGSLTQRPDLVVSGVRDAVWDPDTGRTSFRYRKYDYFNNK